MNKSFIEFINGCLPFKVASRGSACFCWLFEVVFSSLQVICLFAVVKNNVRLTDLN